MAAGAAALPVPPTISPAAGREPLAVTVAAPGDQATASAPGSPWARAPAGRAGGVLQCVGCVLAEAIAAGAVGATQIDPAEVQARVAGTCPGRAVQAIGADGSVACGASTPFDSALLATLRWDLLPRTAGSPFPTGGNYPVKVAFDGTHLWVAHYMSPGVVSKLRVDTGQEASGSPFLTGGD